MEKLVATAVNLVDRVRIENSILYTNNSFDFSREQAFFIAVAAIEVIRLLTFLA